MRLIVKQKPKKTIPAGFYHVVCVGFYDLGTQSNPTFNKTGRSVLLSWELPELTVPTDDGDLPMLISRRYNLSLNKKAILRKHLQTEIRQLQKSCPLKTGTYRVKSSLWHYT